MPSYRQTKMCKECPFRASAPAGWLGPWRPEQVDAAVRNDEPVVCHLSVARLRKAGRSDADIEAVGAHCVGALRYASAMCKLSRDPEKAAAQLHLKKVVDLPVVPAHGFVAHHAPPPPRSAGRKPAQPKPKPKAARPAVAGPKKSAKAKPAAGGGRKPARKPARTAAA